jgi:Zn-finger nucleic acid-binding protein
MNRPVTAEPSSASPAKDASALACPRCGSRMDRHILPVLHERTVEVDHCGGCRLVWFDTHESVALTALGWVRLFRLLQDGAGLAPPPARSAPPACPRCDAPLKTVHNRSRYGDFVMQECPHGHGHLHTHTGVLAERGFVRGLLPAERGAWASREHPLNCLNCGAPTRGEQSTCRFCNSPLVVIDVPRLLHGLQHARRAAEPTPRPEGAPFSWACVACGAAMDPNRELSCVQCGQPAIAPALDDLNPLLDQAEVRWHDAETERRLLAAQQRPQFVPRQRRVGDHRETLLARLGRFMQPDDDPLERLGAPTWLARLWRYSGVLGLLVLMAWCSG